MYTQPLFYLSVEFLISVIVIFISRHCVVLFIYLWSHMMVSVIPSLGICSTNTGSLLSGFQTHVIRCSPERIFPFITFTRDESKIGSIPIFPLWARISYFALQRFHIYKRFYEQIFYDSCLRFVTISRSSGPTDGPRASSVSSTHSLRDFSSFLSWEAFVYFPNSSIVYLKTCF